MSDTGRRADRDAGQAAVELALSLPLIAMLLLSVVQLAVVVRGALAVEHAAQEGARAAAVSADPAASGAAAARRATSLTTTASVSTSGADVVVVVERDEPTEIPLIGWLLPDVHLRASVTMALEPP